ncbi:TonB-dependent receptor [Gammaproteobacteria bacterium AB-CW1]|uniref:TonB-dependent receptor n=1 Tax=Natronospira elongata TaxID=3110268 RepID=A0AAP6MKC6_9GAMM|nr:TonB-dependent receptor [Gammaproteobacteria bacterium AB-CW1]
MPEVNARRLGRARLSTVMLFVGSLPLGTVLAEDQADILTEDSFLAEQPMTVSSSRLPQRPGDSPVSVTVIDREMIEASGAREIQDLLRFVPGAVLTYTFGHSPSATLGFGAESFSRRIEVLVDGRSVYTPSFGGVPWASLPYSVSDIERIEVTRGPNVSAFGTNAFLGSINIITRDPADQTGGEIELLAGDDFIHRAQARYFGSTERSDWNLSAAQWGDNGFDNQNGEFDGKSFRFLNGQMRMHTGPSSQLHGRFGLSRGRMELGRVDRPLSPPRNEYIENRFGQLNWQYRSEAGNLHEVQFQHSEELIDQRFLTQPLPDLGFLQVVVDESRDSTRSDIEYQTTRALSQQSRLLTGLGVRLDRVSSPEAYFPDGSESNQAVRAFGQWEWRPTSAMTINVGAMLEDDDITGSALSPRLALNQHLSSNQTLRLSLSRATRSPVLIEEYGDWAVHSPFGSDQIVLASGGLERETVDSVELGYLFRSHNGNWQIDTRLHHDRIEDMIMYFTADVPHDPFDGEAVDFDNLEDVRITGLETEVEYRPTRQIRLRLSHAYKELSASNVVTDISGSTPRNSMALLAMYRASHQTDFSLGYFRHSSYNIMNLNDGADSASRIDLRVAHRLQPRPDSARLDLVVQAADGDYEESRPRNRFDRRIFGQIHIPF